MPPLDSMPATKASLSRIVLIFLGSLLAIFLLWAVVPPRDFPTGTIVVVPEGSGLSGVANVLNKAGAISSSFKFRILAYILGGERKLQAGEYSLAKPQGALMLAWRIREGDHDINTERITVPEGFTVEEISALFDEKFPFFDNRTFERNAPEGYLFPDTYFMSVTATATSTIKLMKDNFVRKIFDLMPEIEASDKSLEEIVVMASVIESETNTDEARPIVSGILWKRIAAGLPLQVDAALTYITGRGSAELTQEDLVLKSPYNTYTNLGLPPSPISNPGIESLKAALHPTTTPYFYFLTGNDGKMYYARTFDEHVLNKQKYIR
jgi:UPF0755 protein